MTNLRLLAALVIDDVTNGMSLSECLELALAPIPDARDRAFVQALCYGVCRFYSRLDVILSHLLKKPMNAKDSDLHALLLVGLYQLIEMRIPDYAAVTETVNATKNLDKAWARGFANAVLREYLRNSTVIAEKIKSDDEAVYAHPAWWIAAIKKAWPAEWQAILEANNQHPPFTLRVNQRQHTREEYVKKLEAQDHAAYLIPETQQGLMLALPVAVETLPEFSSGAVSVQDGAAQLAAELLALAPGQRVLDACAAPGGKLTHIAEIEPHLAALVAVEKDAARMPLIAANLTRLSLQAECVCQDVNHVKSWWDGQLFDRILLDAPCSASGVIRRHPDIKLLRQPTDIAAFATEQQRLLGSLWPLLSPGGLLLYATCSIFPEENVKVLQQFLAKHSDGQEEAITATWGLPCAIGRQILPGMHGMDGFYYARIRKLA